MNKYMRKLEIIVDRLIPYALILLLFLILAEVLFHDEVKDYLLLITIADWAIISIFVVDLAFKYHHSRTIPRFFRDYWLEIIAVFPAFLVVRVMEEFIIASNLEESITLSQEAAEAEAKAGTRASRTHYFSRFARPLARLPRFLKAFSFYERPTHR